MSGNDAGPIPEIQLPPPTAPANFSVSLRGFADQASAERFGHVMASTVQTLSCCINLERLDGITVAFAYAEALAQLDRGYQATRPLTPTGGDQLVGVAMTPPVLRGGILKSHMVFDAAFVLGLEEEQTERSRMALYLVAHECGHVEDTKHRDEAFPGTILQRVLTDREEIILEQFSSAVWEEYAASRVSAVFGEAHTAIYEQSLVSVLLVARERTNTAIRSYRIHSDINRLLEEAGRPLLAPMKVGAYLLGHLDGLEADFDLTPAVSDQLASSRYAPYMSRLRSALRDLWSRRGRWESLAEFDLLKNLGRDLLSDGGMIFRRLADGRLYVDVPYTSETLP